MTGPFIVVVAGITTAWIAVKTSDGLVTDEYYKKGLAANVTIAQSDRATLLGVQASLRLTAEEVGVRLTATATDYVPPARLLLTFSHPTRAGLDQTRTLEAGPEGYRAPFRLPASGHWLVLIEDEAKSWRLLGNVQLPVQGEALIGGISRPVAADLRS